MNGYRSQFTDWDQRSWVRSKPRNHDGFEPGLHYFAPALCPLWSAAQPAGEQIREAVLVHYLYLFLEFTVRLETGPVNDACLLLRSPEFLPFLPDAIRDDALRIYTDEAGHAEMSHTLARAVARESGIVPLPIRPRFLTELAALRAGRSRAERDLVTLFFVIVSETLITRTLVGLPRDPSMQPAIRAFAADHASDEGRHHWYFRQVFLHVWPRLPGEVQLWLGRLLPRMLLAFLGPDTVAWIRILAQFPAAFPDAAGLVDRAVRAPAHRAALRDNADATVRLLSSAGVLDVREVRAAFRKCDLEP